MLHFIDSQITNLNTLVEKTYISNKIIYILLINYFRICNIH